VTAVELLWVLGGLVLASVGITLLREQVPWPWGALLIAFALCVCLEAGRHWGAS
jgi:hypothetical protein